MITVSNVDPPVRRSVCARSQTLPTVTSSVTPGAAAVRYPNRRLCPSRPASAPDLSWWRSHSCIARSGCTDTENSPGASSTSVVADVVHAEKPGEPLLLGHLADHGAPTAPRREQPEGGGDGGLADPALAGHDDSRLSRSAGIGRTLA